MKNASHQYSFQQYPSHPQLQFARNTRINVVTLLFSISRGDNGRAFHSVSTCVRLFCRWRGFHVLLSLSLSLYLCLRIGNSNSNGHKPNAGCSFPLHGSAATPRGGACRKLKKTPRALESESLGCRTNIINHQF